MRKQPKQPAGHQTDAFVDMENYFKKNKRSQRLEDKRMSKLLKEIHDAENFDEEAYDEDVEQFKRDHHIWDEN